MATGPRAPRGSVSREQWLLTAAALLILIHTVDDTVAAGEVDPAPTLISAIALLAAALYRVLPWWATVGLALFVGITRLIGGGLHLVSLLDGGGTEPGDYTGLLEALGAVLAFVVVVRLLRHTSSRVGAA